ncbi:MAG: hypothetical protein H6839_17470 [Planctomycetes bacterium]|nr:hypothetical protein [Planctomycetota bacterium]
MKSLTTVIAALALLLCAPAFAQQVETLPSGKRVKIIEKDDGTVIILPADAEDENGEQAEDDAKKTESKPDEEKSHDGDWDDFGGDLPKEVQDLLKRVRVKIHGKGEAEPGDEAPRVKIVPWGDGKDMPEEMRKAMEEMRERMEKFRKEADEQFEKLRKEMEDQLGKGGDDLENDPDAEVEEYTKEAPDGSWKIHVKIVRKTSKSSSETPKEEKPAEEPKKESERKQ